MKYNPTFCAYTGKVIMGYKYLYTKTFSDNTKKVYGAFLKYKEFGIDLNIATQHGLYLLRYNNNDVIETSYDPVSIILFKGSTKTNKYNLTTSVRYDRLSEYSREYSNKGYEPILKYTSIGKVNGTADIVSNEMPTLHEAIMKTLTWLDLKR